MSVTFTQSLPWPSTYMCKLLLPTTIYFIHIYVIKQHATICNFEEKPFMVKALQFIDFPDNLLLVEACEGVTCCFVFLNSPFAQFGYKACEFQVSHTSRSNLLHSKLSLNRTWCRASTGLRQTCSMTKEGKHHSESSNAPVG